MTAGAGNGVPREPFWTGPNVLSLSRFPLGFVFAWALHRGGDGPALGAGLTLVAAGATDAIDGAWARRLALKRRDAAGRGRAPFSPGRGSWLDPICDKLFVATVLVSLYLEGRAPLSWLALIGARELLQLPISVVYRALPFLRHWLRYDFTASVLGKLATIAQFFAVACLLVRPADGLWPARLAAFLGLVALGDYLLRAWRLGKKRRALAHHAPLASGPSASTVEETSTARDVR